MKARLRVLTEHERELREIEDKCLAELAELRREEGSIFVFGPAAVWLRQTYMVVQARKQALAVMLKLDPKELDRVRALGLAPVQTDVFGGNEELAKFTLALTWARAVWRDTPTLIEAQKMPDPATIAEAIWARRQVLAKVLAP
jgi:hypothetical protein